MHLLLRRSGDQSSLNAAGCPFVTVTFKVKAKPPI
jgi:hypothetical protein